MAVRLEPDRYSDWIRTYSSDDFRGLADLLDGLLDLFAEDTAAVHAAYAKAMRLEQTFFDSVHTPPGPAA